MTIQIGPGVIVAPGLTLTPHGSAFWIPSPGAHSDGEYEISLDRRPGKHRAGLHTACGIGS